MVSVRNGSGLSTASSTTSPLRLSPSAREMNTPSTGPRRNASRHNNAGYKKGAVLVGVGGGTAEHPSSVIRPPHPVAALAVVFRVARAPTGVGSFDAQMTPSAHAHHVSMVAYTIPLSSSTGIGARRRRLRRLHERIRPPTRKTNATNDFQRKVAISKPLSISGTHATNIGRSGRLSCGPETFLLMIVGWCWKCMVG